MLFCTNSENRNFKDCKMNLLEEFEVKKTPFYIFELFDASFNGFDLQ